MGTVEGNIEVLSQSILGEARAEIEELRRTAHSAADAKRKRAQDKAAEESAAIIHQANQEAGRLRSQASATAQLRARALELEHRERLLDKVFQAAAERLSKVPQRDDYEAVVMELAREALSQLRAGVAELQVDKAAHKIFSPEKVDALAKHSGVQLVLGKPLEGRTGLIARTPDGRLQFDNTLETRLVRMQSTMRSSVYRALMGEAE